MTMFELFTGVAQILGATCEAPKYHTDEPPVDRFVNLVFGDPTDWRTLRLFAWRDWKGDRYEITYCTRGDYTSPEGLHRTANLILRRTLPSITVGATRTAESIAKDILKRIIQPAKLIHDGNIQVELDRQAVKQNKEAWLAKMNNGNGQAWSGPNYSYASIDYVYEDYVNMKLSSITRKQAEAVVKALKGE